MTPSKLRRTAVAAADGVLVVGTGAMAALIGTGTASAAAPTPGWTGIQSPTPSGLNAPASNPNEQITTEGCASAVSCAAAGSYEDGASHQQGLLDTWNGGTWSAVEAPMPTDAFSDPDPTFYGMACPSDGSCVTVGGYANDTNTSSTNQYNGLIETLAGGVWHAMEAPTPSDAAPAASSDTWLKSVSCAEPGDCTAVGFYTNTSGFKVGLIDTLSGGVWTAHAAPQVSDADTHHEVSLGGVSCPSLGNCVADGEYTTNANGQGVEILTETGGTWAASVAPLPSDARTGSSQELGVSPFIEDFGQNLSCAGAQCEIAGYYYTTSNGRAPLLIHGSGTTWSAAAAPVPVPSTAFTGAQEFANLYGASCGFDGWCTAVGSFSDTNNKNEPLVEVVSPSGAVTAQQAPQPSDQASGSFIGAQLQDVSCLSSTDCTAVGWYVSNANSGNPVGLIDTLSGGTWSARPAVTPNNAAMGAAAFSVPLRGRLQRAWRVPGGRLLQRFEHERARPAQ